MILSSISSQNFSNSCSSKIVSLKNFFWKTPRGFRAKPKSLKLIPFIFIRLGFIFINKLVILWIINSCKNGSSSMLSEVKAIFPIGKSIKLIILLLIFL